MSAPTSARAAGHTTAGRWLGAEKVPNGQAAGRTASGRRHRTDKITDGQAAIVGVNIRVLRQHRGWTQAQLGELMGWPTPATVCAAEGHRDGRQRGFTTDEVGRLAAIFGIPPWQLTTRCANCAGSPPPGYSCLACGAQ
jgi:hypothetical protein